MLISTCSFYFIFKVCLSAILDPCSFSGIPVFGAFKSLFSFTVLGFTCK